VKKIFAITFFFFITACQGAPNRLFFSSTSTPTPTLTITPTATFTPSPTFTPAVVSQVIPTDYYLIIQRNFTILNNDEIESVCIQTYTHKVEKSISDEIVEVVAISEYEPVIGDCSGIQPDQWVYQINIYTGELVIDMPEDVHSATLYFGKNHTDSEEDVFSLSGISIPVWKFIKPIEQKDMLDRLVIFEGSEENLIDKATGILIYQSKYTQSIPEPEIEYFLETISLSTNAPIGNLTNKIEFTYSKAQ
jgi:hypothetical protein